MKKRLLAYFLSVLLLVIIFPSTAYGLEVSATAAVLMDADSGEILFEKNAQRQMLIASTTKIMTALVVLDYGGLHQVVTVKQSHMVEGSSMYLKPGEQVTIEELLYGLLLCSGNDAALVLADYCGGLPKFVSLMNQKAQQLGMVNSSFANPNGLDDEAHYSTAYDMALLASYASHNAAFMRLCSTKSVTIDGRVMNNHNRLLREVEGCVGMKTGFTKAAGRTLVSCTRRNGHCLVAVTLQDGNDWADHKALYDYGFAQLADQPSKTAWLVLPGDVRKE